MIDSISFDRIASNTPKILISNCKFADHQYSIAGLEISYLKIESSNGGFYLDDFYGRLEIQTNSGIECRNSYFLGANKFASNYLSFHSNIIVGNVTFDLRDKMNMFKVLGNSFYLTNENPLSLKLNTESDWNRTISMDSTMYPKRLNDPMNMLFAGMNASVPELSIESSNDSFIGEFIFDQNRAYKTDSTEIEISLRGIKAEDFYFRDNKINCRSELTEIIINNRASILNNRFLQTVNLSGMIYSEFSNEIPYDQFKGRIITSIDTPSSSADGLGQGSMTNWEAYYGYTEFELSNSTGFNRLLFSHRQLYNIYKERGDLRSANGVYTDIKSLETRRIKHTYKTKGGMKNFINWKLNQLLQSYTEYGTDPAKAILISIYVILLFSLVYMFFPSTWDDFDRSKMLTELRDGKALRFLRNILLIIVNSMVLSLNAFVTLGFGSIPTKGTPKYITIVQGFIGWFLLGIFSVALINQVLF
ncbi:hypothetical protein [Reichenbachiella faecimaris]|uniref:hypothetical protein n=1 Tax=Reichenbachiella faecimaris TaxID=692418 RepID=UPI00111C12A7|nr:hypothetical protein [Reichenbachiella faecimaris]